MTLARRSSLARGILLAGVAFFWVVQLTLLFVVGMPLLDTILLSVLLVVVPSFSVAQLPLIEDALIDRLPAYWGSIAALWFLGTASWLVGTRADGAGAIGLVPMPLGAMVAWTVVLTLAALGIILVFRGVAVRTRTPDSPLLRQLLPRTGRERGVFAILSVAAGAGEELAFRGYAISVLVPMTGVVGAAALTSVVFGVVHAYQGALGILRTGIMGGLLAWGFLASGSLWPAIIAHTVIDLMAGIVLGDRLLSPEVPTGVQANLDLQES